MSQNTQRLKAEIIAALDFLPTESLKLLAEFVRFLRAKAHHLSASPSIQQKPSDQFEDPLLKLGTQPIVEEVTDASINHDAYLYHK
jgi:hypothetical protein